MEKVGAGGVFAAEVEELWKGGRQRYGSVDDRGKGQRES